MVSLHIKKCALNPESVRMIYSSSTLHLEPVYIIKLNTEFGLKMKSSTLKMCSQSIGWILYRESGVNLYHKFFNLNLKLVHLCDWSM